jgi:hypothetical protein
MSKTEADNLGRGLDVGTMNIVCAHRTGPNKVETSRVRDAFLDLSPDAKKMLKLSGVNFIDHGEEGIIVVGDKAMEMANVFGREARRPLSQGLISAGEIDALEILGAMIKNLLGEPKAPGEYCYFSVPAAPVDDPSRDVESLLAPVCATWHCPSPEWKGSPSPWRGAVTGLTRGQQRLSAPLKAGSAR